MIGLVALLALSVTTTPLVLTASDGQRVEVQSRPHTVYESLCGRLQGWERVDSYPIRSPLVIADFLAPLVAGKVYTEIGTRNGDHVACLKAFASRATAIELNVNNCRRLRKRGVSVLCQGVETVLPHKMPPTDVYFWWPMAAQFQNEVWLRQMIHIHQQSGKRAVAFIAHDNYWPSDMESLATLRRHYSANDRLDVRR